MEQDEAIREKIRADTKNVALMTIVKLIMNYCEYDLAKCQKFCETQATSFRLLKETEEEAKVKKA